MGDKIEQTAEERNVAAQPSCSYTYRSWTSQRIPVGDVVKPNDPERPPTSVFAGRRIG
jgi:hypothetical protein